MYSWQIIFFERAGRSHQPDQRSGSHATSHRHHFVLGVGRPATDAGSTGELVKVKRIKAGQ